MPSPPDWLVAWTNWLFVVIGIITAVLALCKGGRLVRLKTEMLERDLRARPSAER